MVTITKDMETGIAVIDAQHRELIDHINAVTAMGLKSATKEETQKTLNVLGDYIIKHFTEEEIMQRKSGYPDYDAHKQLHQHYVREFEKLKKEFALNGSSVKFSFDLSNSVIGWIVKHIKTVDVAFGKYYNTKG